MLFKHIQIVARRVSNKQNKDPTNYNTVNLYYRLSRTMILSYIFFIFLSLPVLPEAVHNFLILNYVSNDINFNFIASTVAKLLIYGEFRKIKKIMVKIIQVHLLIII